MGPKAPGPWKTLYGNDLAKAPAGTLKQDNFDKTHFRKMWHIPPEPINPGMKTIKNAKKHEKDATDFFARRSCPETIGIAHANRQPKCPETIGIPHANGITKTDGRFISKMQKTASTHHDRNHAET
jgi:hypothetical protein